MKVLLIGSEGQLGRCFLDRAPNDWQITAMGHKELDISSEYSVLKGFDKAQPDVVVNAAAYTAVDKAEEDQEAAYAVNALGAKYLAENSAKRGALLVHVSTDYVFDGTSSTPYQESDPISPRGIYGSTKADGEEFVARSDADYIILRTAWLFSEYGQNFVKTMLRLGRERNEINVVSDQFGGPTYAGDLASAIILIIKNKAINSGIYHYCGYPMTSWAEFAREIFKLSSDLDIIPNRVLVNEITTKDFPTAAVRPAYSMMNCDKIGETFASVNLSNWQKALLEILMKLK